jgi:hypothetical protein
LKCDASLWPKMLVVLSDYATTLFCDVRYIGPADSQDRQDNAEARQLAPRTIVALLEVTSILSGELLTMLSSAIYASSFLSEPSRELHGRITCYCARSKARTGEPGLRLWRARRITARSGGNRLFQSDNQAHSTWSTT